MEALGACMGMAELSDMSRLSPGLLLSGFIRPRGLAPPSSPGPPAWDTSTKNRAGVTPVPSTWQVLAPAGVLALGWRLPTAARRLPSLHGDLLEVEGDYLVPAVPALMSKMVPGGGLRKLVLTLIKSLHFLSHLLQ